MLPLWRLIIQTDSDETKYQDNKGGKIQGGKEKNQMKMKKKYRKEIHKRKTETKEI
jgi:hypothetical protein